MKRLMAALPITALLTVLLNPMSSSAVSATECNRVSFSYSYNVLPYTARAGQSVSIGTNANDATCNAYTTQNQANLTYGQAANGEFNFLVAGNEVGTEPCQFDVFVNGKRWVSGQTTFAAGSPNVQQSDVNITKLNRDRLKGLLNVGDNTFSVVPYCANYAPANITLRANLYTPDPSYSDTPGISINQGDFFTLNRTVTVWLSFDDRISQYAISNYPDFRNSETRIANYKHNDVQWKLLPSSVGVTSKTVYVKYRLFADSEGLVPGAWSDTVYTDRIVLDDVGPRITSVKSTPATGLWDLNMATGTAKTKLRTITYTADDMASQVTQVQLSFVKGTKGAKTLSYTGTVKVLLPSKVSHIHMRAKDVNGNWGPWKFVRTR